ncbi:cation:proton antiporter [Segetibacter sp. 3557_3]|uniref:cation:proton antiporter n=1 Tax=Segetibacter sp. 3557_3 TaxID=2547429 RepID=UPI00140464CC|nr:cation:proton antiporter [Segetibacter sp. 3557_3]
MDRYILLLTFFGLAAFGMAWMPAITKKTGVSYAIIYILLGIILYVLFPGIMPDPDPGSNLDFTVHLTELVVIISLMGTGIKIDRGFSITNWASPLRLVSVAMLLCIGAAAWLGYTLLRFDIAAALLLGAVLAPTDPVLASDVQVGPPNERKKSETKFALTAEAGMNDGMAFPFTWLAILLALGSSAEGTGVGYWFGFYLLYKLIIGAVVGYLLGKAAGYLVFRVAEKSKFLETRDGFLAISLTLAVYGITELVHGYGFVAVFVCAINLRHFEKTHDYHHDLHSFTDQAERLFVALLLILFGGCLVNGILKPLTWQMALFTVLFLLVVRPVAAYLSMYGKDAHLKEKLAISFFGIRGMGSVFYLAFAFKSADFDYKDELWAIVAFTILLSVIIHGITATPIMQHLKEKLPHEEIPE